MMAAISSLGAGAGVLTQSVLDQLRSADEAQWLNPVKLSVALENDKQDALSGLITKVGNVYDAMNALATNTLFDERSATVDGTSVEVTADANSDVQDFSINVINLATKQIEQSGSFGAITDTIASGTGSLNLNIDGQNFTIGYDATTTLDNLKDQINTVAGTKIDATIVQVATGDFRLFMSSVDTGTTQDITLSDTSGLLSGTQLTTDSSVVQSAVDANFEFNGLSVTRTSNTISDLITGYDITLKESGLSNVSVGQDRKGILTKIDNFVTQYNTAMDELTSLTKNSTDSATRGIFAGESLIRNLRSDLQDMLGRVGGGVGTLYDYGFDVDKGGMLSVDKTIINNKMDANINNFEAFFSGGNYDNGNGTTTTLTGAFDELTTQLGQYTKTNAFLSQFRDSITENISTLEDRQQSIIDRLDSKYKTMSKRFTAYDVMMTKINNMSNSFIQMVNAQYASSNTKN